MASPVSAHLDSLSVRTDTTAATAPDRIDGLSDVSLSETSDLVETNYLGGSGFKSRVVTLRDTGIDISGHYMSGDAPQTALRTAKDNGTTVYVTLILDPGATAGSKGKRIPMLVESLDEKMTPGGLCEFSAKLVGNGAPVAV